MDKINFNDLPNDIKNLIFSKNRMWTKKQIDHNKFLFREVVDHINEIAETTLQIYYDANEEEEIIDWSWGFGNAMIECINEENLNKVVDLEELIAFQNYYDCE
tara:strand:+ start:1068 stop:1376 length:309 start_codon:yes stop_codon:yes gene_type:complete